MTSTEREDDITIEIERRYAVKLPEDFPPRSNYSQGGSRATSYSKKLSITTITYDWRTSRLYVGTDDGHLGFWPLKADKEGVPWQVGQHKGAVSCIRIPDQQDGELSAAQLILSGSYDSTIKIWDFKGRIIQSPSVCVQTLYGHGGTITEIAILGEHIISSSTDSTIRLWKAVAGRKQLQYPWFEQHATIVTMDGWVRCMSFCRSSTKTMSEVERLYAADDTGAIICITATPVINPMTRRPGDELDVAVAGRVHSPSGIQLAFRKTHDRGISHIRYIPSQGLVLTIAYDNCIRVYEVASGQLRHCWENENRCNFTGLELDEEFMQVIAVDAAGCMFVFSLQRDALEVTKQITHQPILGMASCLDKGTYALYLAHEVQVWSIKRDLDYSIVRGGHSKEVLAIYACSGGKKSLRGSPHDFRIFSASLDNTVRLWDPYDLCCLRTYEELESEISAMTFHETSNMLVTGHDNGLIRAWDMDSGATITLREHTNTVACLTTAYIQKCSEWLVSVGYDGCICFWELVCNRGEGPQLTAKLQTQPPPSTDASPSLVPLAHQRIEIQCVAFDPTNMTLFTGGNNPLIKVWSLQASRMWGYLSGHTECVRCLAIFNEVLFSGSQDGVICMWNSVPQGQHQHVCFRARPIKVLHEHKECVTGLEVLADRRQLVSVALDGQVIFWDASDGTLLHRIKLEASFRCMAPRFDVEELLLGTTEGRIIHVPLNQKFS